MCVCVFALFLPTLHIALPEPQVGVPENIYNQEGIHRVKQVENQWHWWSLLAKMHLSHFA